MRKLIKDISIKASFNSEEEAKLFEREYLRMQKRLSKKLERKISYEIVFLNRGNGKYRGLISK